MREIGRAEKTFFRYKGEAECCYLVMATSLSLQWRAGKVLLYIKPRESSQLKQKWLFHHHLDRFFLLFPGVISSLAVLPIGLKLAVPVGW